jgi:hypothetical protein
MTGGAALSRNSCSKASKRGILHKLTAKPSRRKAVGHVISDFPDFDSSRPRALKGLPKSVCRVMGMLGPNFMYCDRDG